MSLKEWIIKKYEDKPESDVGELVWLKRKLKAGEKIDWSFVDTVDYDIESIPRKKELVFEFKAKKITNLRKLLKNG